MARRLESNPAEVEALGGRKLTRRIGVDRVSFSGAERSGDGADCDAISCDHGVLELQGLPSDNAASPHLYPRALSTCAPAAHADSLQTAAFVDALAPPVIVLVHGERNEMRRLHDSLAQKYRPTVRAPAARESHAAFVVARGVICTDHTRLYLPSCRRPRCSCPATAPP